MLAEPDRVEDLVDPRASPLGVGRWNSVAKTPRSRLQRQLEVVADGLALEDGRLLELPADAELAISASSCG